MITPTPDSPVPGVPSAEARLAKLIGKVREIAEEHLTISRSCRRAGQVDLATCHLVTFKKLDAAIREVA